MVTAAPPPTVASLSGADAAKNLEKELDRCVV